MELIRRFFSSRAAVGVLVLSFLSLICIWSYFVTKITFIVGLMLLIPVILWSIYEVFNVQFAKSKDFICPYVFLNCFLVLVPSCIFVLFFEEILENKNLWYPFLGCLVGALIVFIFGCLPGIKNGKLNLLFPSILVVAFLLWNIIFFMVMYGHWHWLCIVFLCSSMNDLFAYLFGKKWGKTPLSIYSPNKTQLGFLCGTIFTFLFISLYLLLIPQWMKMDLFGAEKINYWWMSLFFLILGILAGTLGDLYFSRNKRYLGIKDYSFLLGSHGGFWDRFDSHSFSFILWSLCALIWQNL